MSCRAESTTPHNMPIILDHSRSSGNLNFEPKMQLIARISKLSYLKETQKGQLRMSTLDSYHSTDGAYSRGRGDFNEGVIGRNGHGFLYFRGQKVAELYGIDITCALKTVILCFSKLPYRLAKCNGKKGAVFDIDKQIIDDFVTDETDEYGILIIDANKFADKCEKHLNQENYPWVLSDVTYMDFPKIRDGKGWEIVFQKRTKFSHQKEVRLWVAKEAITDMHPYIDIGDMSDFSILYPLKLPSEITR